MSLPTGWTVMPGLVDHHVHLGLCDSAQLANSAVVEVHDLGWEPEAALAMRRTPPPGVQVRVAGPFHTAVGGYPTGRVWAPAGSVVTIAGPAQVEPAVQAAVAAGYDFFKITLHSELPMLDDLTLRLLVRTARGAGLKVGIHAEGPGQAERAIDAGADLLVHAPFTELLHDSVLNRSMGCVWHSTLAIHSGREQAVAAANIRRFVTLGGRVRYGTDSGNGPAPAGVNAAEILALGEAGLQGATLLEALTGLPDSRWGSLRRTRLLASPHPLPRTADEAVRWLADCTRLTKLEDPS